MPAIINGHPAGHPLHAGKAWNALVDGKRIWPAMSATQAAELADRWIVSPPRLHTPSSRATLAGSKLTITHAAINGNTITVQ